MLNSIEQKHSDAMYRCVVSLELVGLDVESYIIYHNYETIIQLPKMKNIIDTGRYVVEMKRNKLMLKDTFIVVPINTTVRKTCPCCQQQTTIGGE